MFKGDKVSVMLVFSTPLVNCCPLPSLSPPPPPLPPSQSLYRQCVAVGGGVLRCVVDHILHEFNTLFLTRFRTYNIATTTPNKNTRKDDIYGLVSLYQFLSLWTPPSLTLSPPCMAGTCSPILACRRPWVDTNHTTAMRSVSFFHFPMVGPFSIRQVFSLQRQQTWKFREMWLSFIFSILNCSFYCCYYCFLVNYFVVSLLYLR